MNKLERKKRYRALKSKGQCVDCVNKAMPSRVFCNSCHDRKLKKAKLRRAKKIENKICVYCSNPAIEGLNLCLKCKGLREIYRGKNRAR